MKEHPVNEKEALKSGTEGSAADTSARGLRILVGIINVAAEQGMNTEIGKNKRRQGGMLRILYMTARQDVCKRNVVSVVQDRNSLFSYIFGAVRREKVAGGALQ